MKTIKAIFGKHHFWALVFTVLPLSIIFLVVHFRMSEGIFLLIFFVILVALHFLMPIGKDILHHHAADKKEEF